VGREIETAASAMDGHHALTDFFDGILLDAR